MSAVDELREETGIHVYQPNGSPFWIWYCPRCGEHQHLLRTKPVAVASARDHVLIKHHELSLTP